jgi:hypothetical protein
MHKRMIFLFVLPFLLAVTGQASSTHTISATLVRVDPDSIEVGMDSEHTTSIALTPDTKYRKWVMAQPWQQDTRADWQDLRSGMRVRVDVADRAPLVAKTVWIVTRY